MFPVIVCIAKKEHEYIEEFVRYHLALGFKYIFIYDNEDTPTYKELLKKYDGYIYVFHTPHNHFQKGIQMIILDDFKKYIMNTEITHVAHIDIDEFIVLKKHANICDFIAEYIVGECQAIGMNWRFFGSSGKTEKTDEPVTMRFTMCQKDGHELIKTLFKKDNFLGYNYTPHNIILSSGYTTTTTGCIIPEYSNLNIDFSVIQLNHYKCKTLPEFRYIRQRGRSDQPIHNQSFENVDEDFKKYDMNEIEDLTAYNFYKNNCLRMPFDETPGSS